MSRGAGAGYVMAALGAAVLGSCAEPGETPGPDAGAPVPWARPPEISWLGDGVPPIVPPTTAMLTPCPPGWRPSDSEGAIAVACDPYPAGGAIACAVGEAHFPGEPACAPVGSRCPMGEWPEGLLDDGTVLFVRPGASGGDGSRSSPLGTIAAAMSRAVDGTIIALAKARFAEAVRLRTGVTLRGACAAETVLTAAAREAVVEVTVSRTSVVDLTIADSGELGLLVEGTGADVRLEGVVISGVQGAGVLIVGGGTLVGHTVLIRDTWPWGDGTFGRGLNVEHASAELTRAVVERNRENGIMVLGEGAHLSLADAAVRDTQPQESDGGFGIGVIVQNSATAELSRTIVEGSRGTGIQVSDIGTRVLMADVVTRDTEARQNDGLWGRGLHVQHGALVEASGFLSERNNDVGLSAFATGTHLTITDAIVRDNAIGLAVGEGVSADVSSVVIERNRDLGVLVSDAGTSLVLTDTVVRDTSAGPGMNVQLGASAELSRVTFERNRAAGVAASGAGGQLAMTDVVVRDTEAREPDGDLGGGVAIADGASAQLERVLVEGNREVGVHVESAGTHVTMTDAVVRDTRARRADLREGDGLLVQFGARAELSRVVLSHNRSAAIAVGHEGTSLVIADAVVSDTESREDDGTLGRGLTVEVGARADVTRVVFERNRELGIGAFGDGTRVVLTDTVVRDTLPRACAETTCGAAPGGAAAGSFLGASLAFDHFVITTAALCGVHLARDGQMDLREGEVSENPIGVCLQVPGYDVSRLTGNVLYRDNAQTLEATDFAVPEPSDPDAP